MLLIKNLTDNVITLTYTSKQEILELMLNYMTCINFLDQIISGKYLILCFLLCLYFSYSYLNDKIVFTSYTSDSYNDYILNIFTIKAVSLSKFSIHFINNKILHPITIFLQNI